MIYVLLKNWKQDIAYLTDLFNEFNEVSVQLQVDSLNFIKRKSIISDVHDRIKLIKQNIT